MLKTLPTLLILASLLATSGCARPTSQLAQLTPMSIGTTLGVQSLAQLDSVRIGMSLRSLMAVRTRMQPASYVGFFETVAFDTVQYHFPEGSARSVEGMIQLSPRTPEADARLVAVEAYHRYASTALAEETWDRRVAPLRSLRHGRLECFGYRHGMIPSKAAVAASDTLWVGVITYPERLVNDLGGPRTVQAATRVFVTTDLSVFIPASAERERFSCPQ